MKTKTLASIFAIVSMFMIVAVSWMPSACADTVEGTKTIDEDQYWGLKQSFFRGDYITLSYTIDVQNDQYIDVMLLNEENYNKYKNGQTITYYSEGTDFNTLYKKVTSITFYTHDNYYLVVDNTDEPPGGAEPAWDGVNNYCTFHYVSTAEIHSYPSGGGSSTTWNGDSEEVFDWLGTLCIMFVIIGIVVAVLVGALLYNKQNKQQAQQPQQPQQPYYRDQQPPPPPDYRPPQ